MNIFHVTVGELSFIIKDDGQYDYQNHLDDKIRDYVAAEIFNHTEMFAATKGKERLNQIQEHVSHTMKRKTLFLHDQPTGCVIL